MPASNLAKSRDLGELRAMLAEFTRLASTNSARAEELEPELLGLAQDIFPEHEDRILAPEDVAEILSQVQPMPSTLRATSSDR